MKDGRPNNASERAPSPGRRGAGRQRGFVERATAMGHSGHGADSVRPHLRDQLKLKALLPQPFPTPEQDGAKKDEQR